MQWRLCLAQEGPESAATVAAADGLYAVIESNAHHPSQEALWGTPGTLAPAWWAWQRSGEKRWLELYLRHWQLVWNGCLADASVPLWTQSLSGHRVQYLGAGHGFAGNAYALLLGLAEVPEAPRLAFLTALARTLSAMACEEQGGVNWPPATLPSTRPEAPPFLMQWCHGAPGVITALAPLPSGTLPELDALLLAAGEAVWRAGPLAKGAGLCHGTAGNGWALLSLYQRTGHSMWLERARCFALHAAAQAVVTQQQHGQPWCGLWTGDAGVALFLVACLRGRSCGLPLLGDVDV